MENWYINPVDGEVSLEELQEKADNGEFHEWNFKPFEYQENGYEDVVEELRKYRAVDYIALDEKRKRAEEEGNTVEALGYKQQMDKMVEDVLKIYRSKNIFPIQYFSELGVMDEIEKCIAYKAKFDGNTVSCVSGDTEYFNGKEWKRIDEYVEGDMVLQYNTDGTGELVKPLDYIHYQSDEPFYTQNPDVTVTGSRVSYLTEKMTGSHNIVCYNYKSNNIRNRDLVKVTLSDLFDLGVETGGIVFIPTGCRYSGSIHEDYTVLLDVFYSVIANKYNGNTYTYIKNGNVCLSDKCFLLDLESRRLLLSFFGISRELFDLKKNTLRACGGCSIPVVSCVFLSDDAIKSINGVLQLTLTSCYLDRDDCDSLSCMLFDYLDILTEKKCYNVSYEKDKYCFTVPSGMLLLRREGVVFITGNCGAGIGTGLCRWLFPNLFDTPSAHDLTKKDAETQYKKFLNDEYLKRAIKFCYSYKDGCPTPTSVEGGLRLVGSAPSNFRPMNAKAVYERFCPKGGTIYDFCSGFGGRMLGALSSKNNYRYVGTDPCTETMYHLHELGEYIEMVTGREDSYELHCCGSEVFRGPANSIDFAFSSPPYFNLEVYSDEPTQCYNKFPKLEEWLEGYVRATIKNIYHMLKPGHFYAVNIADFKVGGGGEVAYVDEWKRISAEEGMPLFDTVYLGVTARAGSAEQAAGELKKENIMVFKKPL